MSEQQKAAEKNGNVVKQPPEPSPSTKPSVLTSVQQTPHRGPVPITVASFTPILWGRTPWPGSRSHPACPTAVALSQKAVTFGEGAQGAGLLQVPPHILLGCSGPVPRPLCPHSCGVARQAGPALLQDPVALQ